MQLLIVHDDAEVGEQLVNMLTDYTAHQCDLVESDAAALRWAWKHGRCGLLLAQLEGPAVDGLTLGGSLSEIFPGLQTLFFPAYPAAEQRLEIAKTNVLPERAERRGADRKANQEWHRLSARWKNRARRKLDRARDRSVT
jgi:DNA-binding NtrC family response regulator